MKRRDRRRWGSAVRSWKCSRSAPGGSFRALCRRSPDTDYVLVRCMSVSGGRRYATNAIVARTGCVPREGPWTSSNCSDVPAVSSTAGWPRTSRTSGATSYPVFRMGRARTGQPRRRSRTCGFPPVARWRTIEQVGDRFDGVTGSATSRSEAWRRAYTAATEAATSLEVRSTRPSCRVVTSPRTLPDAGRRRQPRARWDLAIAVGAKTKLDAELVEVVARVVHRRGGRLPRRRLIGERPAIVDGLRHPDATAGDVRPDRPTESHSFLAGVLVSRYELGDAARVRRTRLAAFVCGPRPVDRPAPGRRQNAPVVGEAHRRAGERRCNLGFLQRRVDACSRDPAGGVRHRRRATRDRRLRVLDGINEEDAQKAIADAQRIGELDLRRRGDRSAALRGRRGDADRRPGRRRRWWLVRPRRWPWRTSTRSSATHPPACWSPAKPLASPPYR